jgi:hypothetical protein
MRGSTYEQVESEREDRGSKEKDRCPLTSMLPAALSEALGISLADIMDRYFDGSEESERVQQIEEALDRRREFEEGEEWLA